MSVAKHLNIKLTEYDRIIRTFIPNYEEMLSEAATRLLLLKRRQPVLVDLGIGTGALTAKCLAVVPEARVIGVDADADMLALARRRLSRDPGRQPDLRQSDFLDFEWRHCDAAVASLALHHIMTTASKKEFYRRCFAALRNGGFLIQADCMPSQEGRLAAQELKSWEAHLCKTYSRRQAQNFFKAWAGEDTYFSLPDEMAMLHSAGFAVEVAWRRAPFAVLWAYKPRMRSKRR
jgi:ubiquinone/menaquinone biosynthesis C-methylase UbiE